MSIWVRASATPGSWRCRFWTCSTNRAASSPAPCREVEGQLQQVPGGAGLPGRLGRPATLGDIVQRLGEIVGGLGQRDKGVKAFGFLRHAVAPDDLLGEMPQRLAGGKQPGPLESVHQVLVGQFFDHRPVQPHQRQHRRWHSPAARSAPTRAGRVDAASRSGRTSRENRPSTRPRAGWPPAGRPFATARRLPRAGDLPPRMPSGRAGHCSSRARRRCSLASSVSCSVATSRGGYHLG